MSFLKKISAMMKFAAKEAIAYRFNFFVDVIFLPFILAVNYYVWKSIYTYSEVDVIRGYTLSALIGYYVVEMITSMFTWSNIDEKLANDIRKGKLTQKLLRPVSVFERQFYASLGGKAVMLAFQAVPLLIIGLLIFKIKVGLFSLWYIPVLLLAYIINYLITFITGTFAFWLKKANGLLSLRRAIIGFVAGGFIPLAFLPLWFQKLSWFMPFQYTKFIPINVFIGKYDVGTIMLIMAAQLVWILVLYWAYKLLWRAGVNKYSGAGQ